MKIVSKFTDIYDLQHAMDMEKVWERKTFSYFQDLELPEKVDAVIWYIGRVFVAAHGVFSEQPAYRVDKLITKHKDEPLLVAVPAEHGGSLVLVNPSVLSITGLAQIETNPYRMHQEIEMFLESRGKLTNGTTNIEN